MHEHCKNMILAKTLKIVLPFRQEHDFQEIEGSKKTKDRGQINGHVFWDFDLGRILEGFWEGFGTKILDFRTIFVIFSMQNF